MLSFLCCLFAVYLTHSISVLGRVRRYRETVIDRDAPAPSSQSWAAYDKISGGKGNRSHYASSRDDLSIYDPVEFCMPFFQMENAKFYISPNGFLALTPYERCPLFCYYSQAPLGGYGFCKSEPDTGDFPVIALFLTDLNPADAFIIGAGVFTWVGTKSYSEGDVNAAIVEWYAIPGYGVSGSYLTGQIELWENGTIILRYDTVPSRNVTYMGQVFPAGTGLVYSKRQRIVSNNVYMWPKNGAASVRAIRYDPVPDACDVNTACAACASAEGCVWCGSSNECVGADIVDDVCPVSDRNGCIPPTLNATDVIPQPFYSIGRTRQSPYTDISGLINATRVSVNSLPMAVPLKMRFPYFYFPPENPSRNPMSVDTVTIGSDFTINVTGSNQRCVRQGISAWLKTPGTQFRSISGQCRDGDYINSIVAYGTPFSLSSNLRVWVAHLDKRLLGDTLCDAILSRNGSQSCPPSFVFQVDNALIYTHLSPMQASFQILLSEDGTVQIHYNSLFNTTAYFHEWESRCESNTAWNQYYEPFAGLFRNGNTVADPSSVPIPWTIMEAGLKVTFSPVPGCLDCGGKGYCDVITRKCVCKNNFVGEQCEECAPGYYGPQCIECGGCKNGGVCRDGVQGNGFCECPAPFGGADCSLRCPTFDTQCPNGCGMGYCVCGTCECPQGTGYFGKTCARWADPCRRNSLPGCSKCLEASQGGQTVCEWCVTSSSCIASWNQKYSLPLNVSRATCLSRVTIDREAQCSEPVIRPPAESGFAVITLIVVFSCVAVCSCLVLAAVCFCRKRPYNPLVLGAVPGVPDFAFPRREREIIGISRLPTQGKNGRPVQGIPLKQIPMSDLVKFQRSMKASRDAKVNPIADASKSGPSTGAAIVNWESTL